MRRTMIREKSAGKRMNGLACKGIGSIAYRYTKPVNKADRKTNSLRKPKVKVLKVDKAKVFRKQLLQNIGVTVALAILLLLINSNSYAAVEDKILAAVKPSWQVTSSPMLCKLCQNSATGSQIEFIQKAGEAERLFIKIDNRYPGANRIDTIVELDFVAPTWSSKLKKYRGWEFDIKNNHAPVSFSEQQTQQVLKALADGIVPVITIGKENILSKQKQIKIGSTFFDDSYLSYLQCQKKLVQAKASEVEDFNVYFTSGSTHIDQQAANWLGYLLAYVKDRSDYKIKLIGYTDNVGSAGFNQNLSMARAQRVKNHLKLSGVDSKNISINAKGAARPISDNKAGADKSMNRRVNVSLENIHTKKN